MAQANTLTKAAEPTEKAPTKRVFILAPNMRVPGPYMVEGTDIRYDIPDEYPLPHETTIVEDGVPRVIRFILGSRSIYKDEQIENEKRPDKYEPTDAEKKILTFRLGRLEIDLLKQKNALAFMIKAGWFNENETGDKRLDSTKTIYQEYNEAKIIDDELDVRMKRKLAGDKVIALSDAEIRDLYTLSIPSGFIDTTATLKKMKLHLLTIADTNPDFIMKGAEGKKNEVMLMVAKAVDLKYIDINSPGQVLIKNDATSEYEKLCELSEAGGRDHKYNRFIEWLMSEEDGGGHTTYAILKGKVQAAETAALKK